jgi:hypothetical protein
MVPVRVGIVPWLVSVTLFVPGVGALEEGPLRAGEDVLVEGGYVSATLRDARPHVVLGVIAWMLDFSVDGTPPTDPVTLSFEHIAPEEAVHRLFGDSGSYTLRFRGNTLQGVTFMGAATGHRNEQARGGAGVPRRRQPPRAVGPHDKDRIPIADRLSEAMNGATEATAQELVGLAMRTTDPSVRRDAWRVGLGAASNDPRLMEEVFGSYLDLPPAEMARMVGRIAPDDPEAFIRMISPALSTADREKARAIRRELRRSYRPVD